MKKGKVFLLDNGGWLLINEGLPIRIITNPNEAADYEYFNDTVYAMQLVGKMTEEQFIKISKQKGRTDNWINKAIFELKDTRKTTRGKNTLYEHIRIPIGEAGGGYEGNIETFVFIRPQE